ncbi:flagellar basal body-associated protein FliL [Pontibacillus sp. HMF3514]|uniref:flagellar basal body-associated protein FliL n=1 Tax=Pontibacillus sp. HMF3514 TaxID=2692425 RepID=UPI0013204793|nr:flagellar basal body-associated protein FliL [Pontibacillus sp. HMF3514]QHE52199.1 flagellar basal body-associated protein FliL [Pontibacillus sp. HMF3514]
MNQKVFKTMLVTLIVITVIGVVALVMVMTISGKEKEDGKPSIDEIIENSFETEELTTDLKNDRFVRIQFRIVTNSKDAKEELQKRDFQLKNILIKELSKMNQDEFKTGVDNLENMLKTRLNELMVEGKVTDVYTINKVLQ